LFWDERINNQVTNRSREQSERPTDMAANEEESVESVESVMGFFSRIVGEIVTSPLNLALVGAIGYVIYRIFATQMEERKVKPEEPTLPKVV
jgi:hypothetical protein